MEYPSYWSDSTIRVFESIILYNRSIAIKDIECLSEIVGDLIHDNNLMIPDFGENDPLVLDYIEAIRHINMFIKKNF
ncbi:hypothetical protein HOK00_10215 [bacterium]|nr:hypothetical protein [bacterium]